MKKLYLISILFVMSFSQLNAQILYNIEKPPSYQKSALTDINNLPSINYTVDNSGNLFQDNLLANVKDYLKIEKIGDKNIARLKFSIAAKSLGEMTLRFNNVILNNGAHCYIYTSDYEIVAGPIYKKSISKALNIVKIPADELILEIVFEEINDFDLILNSISFQPIIDISPKNDNSLQGAIPDSVWDCSSCDYGVKNFVDNVGESYNNDGASLLGAWYDRELFTHSNLYSVNDLKLDAARASCMIMPPMENLPYHQAGPGTLINFPGSDCKGIVISAGHVWQASIITDDQKELNYDKDIDTTYLSDSTVRFYTNYLNNTIIRFNWHHKYGKPIHLTYCNQSNFALWRKTIDFDEVIDYCGATGFAFSNDGNGDYTIIKMKQMPFYKELHLGWSTQKNFDTLLGKYIIYPERFLILAHHGGTPTYVFKNSGARIFPNFTSQVQGIDLHLINGGEPPIIYEGYSGSQLMYLPDYPNPILNNNKWIGVGLIHHFSQTTGYEIVSENYSHSFNDVYTNLLDPDLTVEQRYCSTSLYTCYLSQHQNELNLRNGFYWMPTVENREKCPSTLGGGTDPCTFNLNTKINVVYPVDGTMKITINYGDISSNDFQGNQYPKGVRIYNTMGDQQTFYFDTFADNINIPSTIQFTISQCDIFYYQMMGLTSLTFGIDYYDINGKILNANRCNMKYNYHFPNTLCEALSITTERNVGNPLDSCCSYTIRIKFKGCEDYSNILRIMLNTLSLKNLSNNSIIPLDSLSNITANYELGEISFTIGGICTPTSYKLLAPFGGSKNCESYNFTLDCTIPDTPCDCCAHFWVSLERVYALPDSLPPPPFQLLTVPNKFALVIHNVGDWGWGSVGDQYNSKYCSNCQFLSAHIYCPSSSPSSPPIYDETFAMSKLGYNGNGIGTFEGLPNGEYCFYIDILTNQGICHDTLCTTFLNGSFYPSPYSLPTPIEIDKNDNSNNQLNISTQLEYDKIIIVDLNGKVLIESIPIDKINVSNLPKGTYNILYKKKNKVLQSQKLIIK